MAWQNRSQKMSDVELIMWKFIEKKQTYFHINVNNGD